MFNEIIVRVADDIIHPIRGGKWESAGSFSNDQFYSAFSEVESRLIQVLSSSFRIKDFSRYDDIKGSCKASNLTPLSS